MIALLLLCCQSVDAFGDPLPEGAVARLGTVRWRHGGYVLSVAFSPDSRHVLSASESVALWDLKTGLRIRTFEGSSPVAFADEGRALSASPGGTLVLWDLATGRRLREFEGAKGWIHAISVDRRGRFALAGGQDGTVRLWNLDSGACVQTREEKNPIGGLALSPDGRRAFTSSWKGKAALIWDVESGKPVHLLEGLESDLRSAVFTPDGRHLLAGYVDGAAELREVDSGKVVYALPGGSGRIEGITVSADGKLALSANSDHTLTLWEQETGKLLRTFRGHRWTVFSAAFSPDGRHAVSGAGDGTVGLWDVATGRRLNVSDTHDSEVLCGSFTSDGRRALTGSQDQTIALWDWATGRRVRSYAPTGGTPWDLTVAPDGRTFLVANGTSVVKWDLGTGKAVPCKVDVGSVDSVAVSADGGSFVSGGNLMHLWDLRAGRELKEFQGSNGVRPVAFLPDGRHVLAGQRKVISKWNLETGKLEVELVGHEGNVRSLSVSLDGHVAVSGSDDGTAAIWDLDAGRRIMTCPGASSRIRSVALHADGSVFASGSSDGMVCLWDALTGKRLAAFAGHLGPVHSVAFSPSGAEILSTSGDTSSLVWRPSMKFRERAKEIGVAEALATLGSPDFDRCCEAREALRLHGEKSIDPLLQAYPPESGAPPAEPLLKELEARLENDSPEVRRKALEALEGWGRLALPWIGRRLAAGASPELQAALKEAQSTIERKRFRPLDRGRVRAVLLLLDLPSGAAVREALKRYAAGPAESCAAELARRAAFGG